mgnify:CR=1 FL=1
MDYIMSFEDVYVVNMKEGLEYVRNPVPLSQIDTFEPFQCEPITPVPCNPVSCRYGVEQLPEEVGNSGEKYMMICCPNGGNCCPSNYPWLGNPLGL